MLRRAVRTVGLRRSFHSSNSFNARILASDAIEKICGDSFKARGHELVEKPGI